MRPMVLNIKKKDKNVHYIRQRERLSERERDRERESKREKKREREKERKKKKEYIIQWSLFLGCLV